MKVNDAVVDITVKAYTKALNLKINNIETRATRNHLGNATKVYLSQLDELKNLLNEFELFLQDNNLMCNDKE